MKPLWRLLFKIRALIAGIGFILLTMVIGLLIILSSFTISHRPWENALVGFWARLSLWLFGIRVECQKPLDFPRDGVLFLFNHTSHFDILILQSVVPQLRFGAKIELFKIPIFGMAMRRAGVLPITRQNREKVFRVYERAKSKVEGGASFALAPEGTRQISEQLGPFKAGPFIFAINAQMPIVPVVIQGAAKLLPKHQILPNLDSWSSTVKISFAPPVSAEAYSLDNRQQLQEEVRSKMLTLLQT